jgi:hypothetical protein
VRSVATSASTVQPFYACLHGSPDDGASRACNPTLVSRALETEYLAHLADCGKIFFG